ncbi:Crp/Fnr family transcriptional regulator [Actinoplanes sichuanensis]|uniref:Crp/Fnr family transcriptional regulator n=1 Tax=Actinoplanes sichuanensis TaxID=512349 RepID=A0ABW4A2I5_9ACTN|nr:Crp/Fnr family transcriptional regulator [Actinoplanes sichuanensis]BEL12806.1 Crp/Fnr family transcriptional regulator [Actinoplanes sichuanensis]
MSGFGDFVSRRLSDHLPEPAWADLLSLGVPVHFLSRQVLFLQGDAGRHVYAIREGTVKVIRTEHDGRQTILTLRGAGDVLGDMAAFDRGFRSATVIAMNRVRAQLVTAADFRAFLSRPHVAAGYAVYTVERLRQADIQRSEITLLPVRTRLARALLRVADGTAVRMSQQDVALYVGASRNAVVEELTALRVAAVIRTRRGVIQICDLPAMREIAAL